jgi:D-glycero-D-manno-heptose 1,7-bisphosphate phosphatase
MMDIDEIGLWCEVVSGGCARRPGVFLDRDGVIVEEVNYLGRAEDVRLLPGAAAAIGHFNRKNIPVVVVTNQSGVGRGYYDWPAFQAVQAVLSASLADDDAHIDAVFACAYHGDAKGPYQVADHFWRKPNPGMILAAAERMQLDLAKSWVVGDRASDLAAGRAAALAGGVLVATGHGKGEQTSALALAGEQFIVRTSATLSTAVDVLIDALCPHHC